VDLVSHDAPTRRRLALVSAATAGAILLVTVLTSRGSDRRPGCRGTLIPAYFSPAAIVAAAKVSSRPRLVVVNPANGPGRNPRSSYHQAVREAQEAGARVLGYVSTAYGARPASDVLTDVDRWASWYAVDGIFLDEASHDAAQLPYYTAISRHIRASGRLVVVNPGVVPAPEYFGIADVVVTFEGSYADYSAAVARIPDWVRRQPPDRVAHLVYGASRDQALTVAAHPDAAGYLFVTSGSLPDPWQTLPPYLAEEEGTREACS
jgi:hypothetical protein